MKLYSTGEAAEQLECHRDTIWRLAKQHDIGVDTRRGRLLSPEDIEAIRELRKTIRPGNPNWVSPAAGVGNQS